MGCHLSTGLSRGGGGGDRSMGSLYLEATPDRM